MNNKLINPEKTDNLSRVDVFWQLMKNLSTDPRVTEFISSFES